MLNEVKLEVKGEIGVNKYFRLQLTIILIIFSLFISLVISLLDYGKLNERVRIGHETKIEMAEDKVIESLSTLDSVYNLFDHQMADQMKIYSDEMLAMYDMDPDFSNWNFDELKERYGMDIYIIDGDNTIIHSSFKPDIGLDFEVCCSDLAKLVTQRREGHAFSHDGKDLQQFNGELKKFSYVPTPDNKYLLELGVTLEEKEIFQEFNFKKTISALERKYDAINTIRIYNSAGFLLGFPEDGIYIKELSSSMLPIFRDAILSGEPRESVQKVGNHFVTHSYIPYKANKKRGLSTVRAIEIVYNDIELTDQLMVYRNEFLLQVLIIIIAAIVLSLIIARLVAKPIHLAFHDSLTGLKNRAAFSEDIKKRLTKRKSPVALMVIDIDNFKLVNDTLGHSQGDKILQLAASTIQYTAGANNVAARIGGDEFVVLFSSTEETEIRLIASELLSGMNEALSTQPRCVQIGVSFSIGIACAVEGDSVRTLYEKADQALYTSKRKGKNQYNVYDIQNGAVQN
ncbi:GGDEF domain-containing protein [Sporosarcina limicola]|uniref:Diguanylate cyclase (GGDEF)-like protein n=1 Tax=Sporosarcina limicola TaxID=34101 RepID=A0A927MGZ8_9BACL|nr:GGDEF domain-containing protein [Sporosarcina limicola]MBE1554435.1 diguanylate cyclase (GGDEF)-like protein [Sporosarcina limicola]